MHISLNGETADSRGAQTIDDLVRRFELPAETVLIEHNGVALRRRDWPQTPLVEGDRLEIVRVAAGG
jgi:sulfur carrier protein